MSVVDVFTAPANMEQTIHSKIRDFTSKFHEAVCSLQTVLKSFMTENWFLSDSQVQFCCFVDRFYTLKDLFRATEKTTGLTTELKGITTAAVQIGMSIGYVTDNIKIRYMTLLGTQQRMFVTIAATS